MIYVKAVAVCDTAPMTKTKCRARKNYDVDVDDVHSDHKEPSLPAGWGRPGQLHAYVTLIGIPDPAPWEAS